MNSEKQESAAGRSRQEKRYIAGTVFITAVLAVTGILSFVLPKATFSEYEKRELAPMPHFSFEELFRGTYLLEFEEHYADTFPARDSFIQLAAAINKAKGITGEDQVRFYDPIAGQGELPASSSGPESGSQPESQAPSSDAGSESESESSSAPPEVPDGYVTQGCFIMGDRGCYLFGGYRPVGELYAGYLTAFADRLDGAARVYNIIVPTSGDYYIPEKYRSLTASQKDNIAYTYSCLGPSVTPVDAWSEIGEHTDEYIYFRTDHHWTTLGAYYAYTAFCETAGLTPIRLDGLEKRTISPFVGTIYNETRDSRLSENPDYVDYYIIDPTATARLTLKNQPNAPLDVSPYCESSSGGNSYGVFIWADNPLFEIKTSAGTGRTCLLLKESYGNAFAPWLMANYDTVYVIDYRHYEKSVYSFVLENGVDDVIFINNAFASNTAYHADRINYLCNQL